MNLVKAVLVACVSTVIFACSSKPPPQGIVGGADTPKTEEGKKIDEMLLRQQKEVERQKKEVEDIKRQKYYDEQYRDYEAGS